MSGTHVDDRAQSRRRWVGRDSSGKLVKEFGDDEAAAESWLEKQQSFRAGAGSGIEFTDSKE